MANPADPTRLSIRPSDIQGKAKKQRVPTDTQMEKLAAGFEIRIARAQDESLKRLRRYLPRRMMMRYVHRVLMYTGLRPSECLFLQTMHVDHENMLLVVEGAVSRNGEPEWTKSGKLKGSKAAGTRKIPLIPVVLDAIDEWLSVREEHGFPSESDCAVIFCDTAGEYIRADSLNNHYRAASDKAKIESVTPYQCRHWHNDMLRRMGMAAETRQAVMGHESERVNRGYTHAKAEEARAVLEKLGGVGLS